MQKLRANQFYVSEIHESDRRDKKYYALVTDGVKVYKLYFGAIKSNGEPYDQYEDKTPLKLYKEYNHYDEERKRNYWKRHKPNLNYITPDYLSAIYLW
jgi:DNA-binding PadR family transcriptional regulator